MLPTCETKMIFSDPHPIDCFLCNESTGFASWLCHSLLFRGKYLHIHCWTALCWILVWGANWLDYHTVVTSSLKLSGALTARGVTDTDVFFIAWLCIFTGALKKRSPLYPTSRPFLWTRHTFLYSKQDSTSQKKKKKIILFPPLPVFYKRNFSISSLVTMLSSLLPSDAWFWSHHSTSEI